MAFYKYNKSSKELEMIASGKGQLTMDQLPTAGSTNTVTSDGIKTAIDNAVTKNQKNVILIQDSYGTNNGSGTTISTTIPLELDAILDEYGINLYSKASNGAGFCNGAFKSNLTTLAGAMTAEVKTAITDIWVLGGWNDEINRNSQTEEQLKTAMGTFLTYAKANFPNADIHLAFISYGYAYQGLSTDAGYLGLYKTLKIYRESTAMGIKYEGRLETVLHNTNYLVSDLAHPNADGCKYTAARLADLILTGDTHIHHRTEYLEQATSGVADEYYSIEDIVPNTHTIKIIEEVNDNLYTMTWETSDNCLVEVNSTKTTKGALGAYSRNVATYMPKLIRIATDKTIDMIAPCVVSWTDDATATLENNHGAWVPLNIRFTPKTTEDPVVKVQYKPSYFCEEYLNWSPKQGYNLMYCLNSCSYSCDAMKLI